MNRTPPERTLPRVITIDGPASAGKTSVAEALAERIGYHVYDTGALYRAATLLAVRAGITDVTPDHEAEIVRRIHAAQIVVAPPKDPMSEPTVTVDGADVTAELRAATVNGLVSPVSQLPRVRDALMEVQRAAAAEGGVIMVGRDMGTVVVPDASLKLYLTADPQVRAERRTRQLAERGTPRPFDEVLREETERDRIDSGRTVAPLRPAPDAVTITTDHLTVEQIVARAAAEVERVAAVAGDDPAQSAPAQPATAAPRPKAAQPAAPAPSPNRFAAAWRGTRSFHLLYRFTCGVVRLFTLCFASVSVRGAQHMPQSGPVVVAANHLHNFDPMVLSTALPRDVYYMAKREIWQSKALGWFLELYGVFPIDRGAADRPALRHAEGILKRGGVLGMFPEGTRSPSGAIERVLPGAAFMAIRTGAPVLPVAITGTTALPFDAKNAQRGGKRRGRGRITITIGEPFALVPGPNGKHDPAAATDTIMRHIAAMLPPEYRGIYGEAGVGGGQAVAATAGRVEEE